MKRCSALFAPALVALLLSACASRAPVPLADVERHPHSIAIIPVLDPEGLSIDRGSMWYLLYGGLGIIVERVDMVQKRRVFATRFEEAMKWIGPELTEALREAAVRRGYDAIVLDHIERIADDPEEFDYQRIATDADVIVHVRVRDLGLYSPTFTNDYVTQLDLSVIVAGHRSGVLLVDDDFNYGVNGNRKEYWAVPASDKYRFSHFGDILDESDTVVEGWHVGAKALAARIIEHLDELPRR